MSDKKRSSVVNSKSSSALVYVTAKNTRQAMRIGRTVVMEKLAACANSLAPIRSVYLWNGALQQEHEVILLLKTRRTLVKKLAARIAELHSYKIPCVVSVDIDDGHAPFLDWIQLQTAD